LTDDQQFILGVLGVISTIAIQALAVRKAGQTHDLVNGMTQKRDRRARSAGAAAARRTDAAKAARED
jgi:heme exporter protein D